MDKIRILVIDDHAIIREGLKGLLDGQPDMAVVGAAKDGEEGLEMARALRPDIVLVDIMMPGMSGLDVVSLIKEAMPDTKAIIFTMHNKDIYVDQATKAGAQGYVLKTAPSSEVSEAIRTVYGGGNFLAPEVKEEMIRNYFKRQSLKPQKMEYASLSKREQLVFRLMIDGKSTKEMANILCLSVKTVEKYRSSVMRKLDLHNLIEATRYAVKIGIIDIEIEK